MAWDWNEKWDCHTWEKYSDFFFLLVHHFHGHCRQWEPQFQIMNTLYQCWINFCSFGAFSIRVGNIYKILNHGLCNFLFWYQYMLQYSRCSGKSVEKLMNIITTQECWYLANCKTCSWNVLVSDWKMYVFTQYISYFSTVKFGGKAFWKPQS